MTRVPYDRRFDPPAPVLSLQLRLPLGEDWLQLAGVVDTGADITVFPEDIAARHLPVAGQIGVRGVTGVVQRAVLYRAELRVAGARRVLVVAGFGLELIVGRDLLRHLIVELDGPADRMTVTVPHVPS